MQNSTDKISPSGLLLFVRNSCDHIIVATKPSATFTLILAFIVLAKTALCADESRQAKKQRLSSAFNDLHREEVQQAWQKIITSVSPDEAKKLGTVKIHYTKDEAPLRFEMEPGHQPILLITTGGLIVEDNITDAYGLVGGGCKDRQWLTEYLYYLRKQYLGHWGYYSATTAAGFDGADLKNISSACLNASIFFRKNALLFTLAHEAAHLLNGDSEEQRDGESDSDFQQRIRMQEARADDRAVDILLRNDDPPAGFIMLLLATMIIYEPRDTVRDANLHVPDRSRIRPLATRVRDAIAKDHRPGTNQYRKMINDGIEGLLRATEPAYYSAMMNERDEYLKSADFFHLYFPEPTK
jgi:hypothetical protein